MDTEQFNEQELINALREAQESGDQDGRGAMTTTDIREATGWSAQRVRTLIKSLMEDGKVEMVRLPRQAIDRVALVPHYRMKGDDSTGINLVDSGQ